MLSDRRQRVLAALIEEYVARAMPVGSRTLTERYELGVSPATIRNELSVLEDGGYISQPHTSAGRVPTDYGYRAFVDRLVQSGSLSEDPDALQSINELRKSAQELDDLLDRTSSALAQFTNCLTIVAPQDKPHPRRMGMSSLMRQPEFTYTQSLLPIMQVLEDETILLEILDATPCEVPVIKEVFLLCCYCNLTHEEAFALKWSNITTTPEGRMRVDIYRPKTSTRSTFLIPVKAERYLPKRTTDDDFIFKPLSTETKDINDAFRIWTRSSILERRITFTRYKATYMRIYAERRYKSRNGR